MLHLSKYNAMNILYVTIVQFIKVEFTGDAFP